MFSELIERIIALIISILLPFFSTSPVVAPQVTVESVKAAVTADLIEENYEPIATWDVSATENDNVTMSFYDVDAATLFNGLTGKIAALFTPITAYAATVEFIGNESGGEFGNVDGEDPAEPVEEDVDAPAIEGVAIVTGGGKMEANAYRHFLSIGKYVKATEAAVSAAYGIENVEAVYDEAITDVMVLDGAIEFINADTGEYIDIDEAVREEIVPTACLRYSPTVVEIAEGVESVSDYAFMFCGNLEEIYIPEGVTEIGDCAFAYCSALTTVSLPSTLELIGDSAFMYCTSLDELYIPASVTFIRAEAFIHIAPNAVITCANNNVRALINDGMFTGTTTVTVATPVDAPAPNEE